jgi:hypothetical protein
LGEPSGTNANDETANNNDGTYTGSPTLAQTGALTGDSNTAVKFNTVADYVLVADHSTLDFGDGPFSVEFWCKWDSSPGYVISKGNQFTVRVVSNHIALDNDDTGIAFETQTAITDGLYHHWVISRSGGGSGNTKIYMDGVSQTLTEFGPNYVFATNAVALNLGRYSGGGVGFPGTLDEVALYSTMLSAARVLVHYEAGTIAAAGPTRVGPWSDIYGNRVARVDR